jgi:hypothetical protein
MKTKRITLPISEDIESIKERLTHEIGINMTYNQVISYLIWFYIKQNLPKISVIPAKPKTQFDGIETPQRKWHNLRSSTINALFCSMYGDGIKDGGQSFARAIEAKLREKNFD